MPIRRSHAKVAVGLFWAESWLFWSHFLRYRLQYRLNSCNLQKFGRNGLKSISGIWSSNSCKNNHGKILIVAEVTKF